MKKENRNVKMLSGGGNLLEFLSDFFEICHVTFWYDGAQHRLQFFVHGHMSLIIHEKRQ